MSGVSAPLSGLRSAREALDDHWAVYRQNEELRAQIEELEGWRELALSLRDKVSAYEAILDIPGVQSADPIGAWTVAESGGPFQHARLMAAGEDKGIKSGYPVLTDRGLVGRVVSVSERSSRVLLLTDVNSRVPVMTEDGEVRAMLTGDNSGQPKLEFASGGRTLEPGDRIVTSGDAGVFPRGLPIGVAGMSGDEVWRVALYSDRAPIDAVWVYPYDPVEAPAGMAETPIFPVQPGELPAEPAPEGAEGAGDEAAAPAAETAPAEQPAPVAVAEPTPEPEPAPQPEEAAPPLAAFVDPNDPDNAVRQTAAGGAEAAQ